MRINTRFPVAVHIMALLALNGKGDTTSERIARSVNTNPVVIRRINAMLKKAGLITVRAGVGKTALARVPRNISLLDVYHAVKTSEDALLFDLHSNPNPKCPIGLTIHGALSAPLTTAQHSLEKTLSRYSLADIARYIAERRLT